MTEEQWTAKAKERFNGLFERICERQKPIHYCGECIHYQSNVYADVCKRREIEIAMNNCACQDFESQGEEL